MRNDCDEIRDETPDPLGLRGLPLLEPDRDGWSEIRAALETGRAVGGGSGRSTARRLALVACLLLVASVVFLVPFPGSDPEPVTVVERAGSPGVLTQPAVTEGGAGTQELPLHDLIAMSQVLEQRLRTLRNNTASMPADSVVYVTELEDLVARVDSQLSYEPDSIDLWGQRVNLLLDLEYLFQHQFEREYGRMASL